MQRTLLLVALWAGVARVAEARTWRRTATVVVRPGHEDCYFVPNVTQGQRLDIDFQVTNTDTHTGQLDVTARLLDAHKQQVQVFERANEGNFDQFAHTDGDYSICFDNTYSTFSSKSVYLDIALRNPKTDADYYDYDGDEYIDNEELENMKKLDLGLEDSLQMTVKEIKRSVSRIRESVAMARHEQDTLSADYARDMNNALNTQAKVTLWSVIQLTLILVASLAQVFVLKGLFDPKYSFQRIVSKVRTR